MNVKSISNLDENIVPVNRLSALQDKVFIELTIKNNETHKFESKKVDFGEYTAEIVQRLYARIALFNAAMQYFRQHLNEMKLYVQARITALNVEIQEFMKKAHDIFLHKSVLWTNTIEQVYNNKHFCGDKSYKCRVSVTGTDSLLCALNVIEGAVRRTYYYP